MGDSFVEKFHLQEAEPTCDKVIRMPIADNAKMKAADYRNQVYAFISQRRKQAAEEKRPGRRSSKASVVSTASALVNDNSMPLGWSHEGGAAAPPTTPRMSPR